MSDKQRIAMRKVCLPIFLGLLVNVNSAQAVSTSFLKDAPVSHFNNEDINIFIKAATAALNEASDGELRDWSNPKTGSSGSIKPLDTVEGINGKCRTVQFTSSYKTLSASGQNTLCKQADGSWKVPSPGKKAK